MRQEGATPPFCVAEGVAPPRLTRHHPTRGCWPGADSPLTSDLPSTPSESPRLAVATCRVPYAAGVPAGRRAGSRGEGLAGLSIMYSLGTEGPGAGRPPDWPGFPGRQLPGAGVWLPRGARAGGTVAGARRTAGPDGGCARPRGVDSDRQRTVAVSPVGALMNDSAPIASAARPVTVLPASAGTGRPPAVTAATTSATVYCGLNARTIAAIPAT